jgi:O-antigen/teichoic acid export membrane protein
MLRIDQSSHIFRLLMIGFVAISTTYVFGTLLTANGSLKQLNIVAASGVIISLVINLSLVPRLEALGSAYASLSSQGITALAQVIIALIIFKFRRNFRYILAMVVFVTAVIILGWLSPGWAFNWKFNLLIMILGSVVLAVLLRLLHIREFIRIIQTEKV